MTIARIGDFALTLKGYLGEHEYTTHDIEIVKYEKVDKSRYSNPDSASDETCYTIATFKVKENDPYESDVVSCGRRLVDAILDDDYDVYEKDEALMAVKKLIDIGFEIICTENVPSGYEPKYEYKAWTYNTETGLLDEVKDGDE